jgi:predicted metal-dependent peptidase
MAQLTNKEKLTKAKAKLIMSQPFFASLVCNLPMIEDDTINPPTMCTNGKYIKFHPGFVEKCSLDEVVFVLCHEVGHCMFQHMFRRGARHPLVWNLAGDYIINDMLVKEQVGVMPQGALHDPTKVQAGGGTTEGVFGVLWEEVDQNGGDKGGDFGLPGQFDNCEDYQGSEAEKVLAEAEMKIAVQQAASAAKMCGKLGGSLERFVNEALSPKVDWKAVLRRFVSSRSKTDRSYARPKRRFLASGLYLPGLSGEKLGEMAVAVDCSGSISPKEINEFAAEINAIKQDMHPERLHVLYFHDEVAKHDVFEREDELVVAPNGTGGTAFSPIFKFLTEQGVEPSCCVVLTDLCCSDFGEDPGYPVLWVSTLKGRGAPWGDVVPLAQQ